MRAVTGWWIIRWSHGSVADDGSYARAYLTTAILPPAVLTVLPPSCRSALLASSCRQVFVIRVAVEKKFTKGDPTCPRNFLSPRLPAGDTGKKGLNDGGQGARARALGRNWGCPRRAAPRFVPHRGFVPRRQPLRVSRSTSVLHLFTSRHADIVGSTIHRSDSVTDRLSPSLAAIHADLHRSCWRTRSPCTCTLCSTMSHGWSYDDDNQMILSLLRLF